MTWNNRWDKLNYWAWIWWSKKYMDWNRAWVLNRVSTDNLSQTKWTLECMNFESCRWSQATRVDSVVSTIEQLSVKLQSTIELIIMKVAFSWMNVEQWLVWWESRNFSLKAWEVNLATRKEYSKYWRINYNTSPDSKIFIPLHLTIDPNL